MHVAAVGRQRHAAVLAAHDEGWSDDVLLNGFAGDRPETIPHFCRR